MTTVCVDGNEEKGDDNDIITSSNNIFTVQEVEAVAVFFSLIFGQHVRLYQYVCNEIQPEVLELRLLPVQTPLFPLSLTVAVSEDINVLDTSISSTTAE